MANNLFLFLTLSLSLSLYLYVGSWERKKVVAACLTMWLNERKWKGERVRESVCKREWNVWREELKNLFFLSRRLLFFLSNWRAFLSISLSLLHSNMFSPTFYNLLCPHTISLSYNFTLYLSLSFFLIRQLSRGDDCSVWMKPSSSEVAF